MWVESNIYSINEMEQKLGFLSVREYIVTNKKQQRKKEDRY